MVPLVYMYQDDSPRLISAVNRQTLMTHNNPEIAGTAEFFARTVLAVFEGVTPQAAIAQVTQTHFNRSPWIHEPSSKILAKCAKSRRRFRPRSI